VRLVPSPGVTPRAPFRASTAAPATRRAVGGDRRAHPMTEGFRCMNARPIRDDEQLIGLFLFGAPDEAESAFEALVTRHRPAVMTVCGRVLDRIEDAEDAAQATFAALVRHAGRIRDRRVLGSWLCSVAYRVALRMKGQSVRRRAAEIRAGGRASPGQAEDAAALELRQIVHDEVRHLPEEYRKLVVLSYLEGRSNEEVSRILNCPSGTVKGRLWRARGMLRVRLLSRVGRAVEVLA
jgi:RNA polymerase sigma factor (sigma-70 family)